MDNGPEPINGPETVRQMRESGFTGIVIGATGLDNQSLLEHFLAQGADRILMKPLTGIMLSETLQGIQSFYLIIIR